jgi:hypothetical protein
MESKNCQQLSRPRVTRTLQTVRSSGATVSIPLIAAVPTFRDQMREWAMLLMRTPHSSWGVAPREMCCRRRPGAVSVRCGRVPIRQRQRFWLWSEMSARNIRTTEQVDLNLAY